MKINGDQKETAIETIRIHGTMKAGAEAAGVSVRTLNEEMRRSAIFKRRILEAREEGKQNLGDGKLQFINDVADGKIDVKMPRLTAALAIANWSIPGFRGATTVQGKIDHDVRVITAVPRPNYELPKVEVLDNTPRKMLKSGKRTKKVEILDQNGKYIGTQTVEEAIEGEVIKESE